VGFGVCDRPTQRAVSPKRIASKMDRLGLLVFMPSFALSQAYSRLANLHFY